MAGHLDFHPVAEVFPLLEGEDFEKFADDIEANGLRDPILLAEGMIADGRNRQRACESRGVQPRYEEWDGKPGLVALIISRNLHRRHLDPSQRAMVAARIANMSNGQTKAAVPKGIAGVSQAETAQILNVSRRNVARAAKVQKHGDPALVDAVDAGEIAVTDAAKIVDKPKAAQREAVAKVKAKTAKTAVQALTETQREDEPATGLQDAQGVPVPKKLVPVFRGKEDFEALLSLMRKACDLFDALCKSPAGHFLKAEWRERSANMSDNTKTVRYYKPHSICPNCEASGKDCNICKGAGWIYRALFNQPGVGKDAR